MKYPIFFSLLFFIECAKHYAQETDTDKTSFTPPFDFPITFSGNFGEIRANHFHGGLDFKTGGTIGKPVRAWPTDIFRVSALPTVRAMCSMWLMTMVIRR